MAAGGKRKRRDTHDGGSAGVRVLARVGERGDDDEEAEGLEEDNPPLEAVGAGAADRVCREEARAVRL